MANRLQFVTSTGIKVERVSRWIRIDCEHITKKSKFYDYSDEGSLFYFRLGNRRIPLGRFMRFDYCGGECPVIQDGGYTISLAGYDATEYYRPLMIEIEKGGEAVRLYREVV